MIRTALYIAIPAGIFWLAAHYLGTLAKLAIG